MASTVVNGNITLEYEVHGPDDGEPVLLIHGLSAQLVEWPQGFVDRLTGSGHRVVLFDNRDIGRSSRVDAPAPTIRDALSSLVAPRRARPPYTLGDMADDAAELLDVLGIGRAHVIGASMGGMIAQEMAIRHPDKVATLCSMMSTGRRPMPAPGVLPDLIKVMRSGRQGRDIDDMVALYRLVSGPHFDETATRAMAEKAVTRAGDPVAAAAGIARQRLAAGSVRDRTEDLGRLDVPTLILHGMLDRMMPLAGAVAAAKMIAGARLVAYPDMAHDFPEPRLDEMVHELIQNFERARITAPALVQAVEG